MVRFYIFAKFQVEPLKAAIRDNKQKWSLQWPEQSLEEKIDTKKVEDFSHFLHLFSI